MCKTLSKMTLGVLLAGVAFLSSPLVAQDAAPVTVPQLLTVTFDNQLDKPIDIYAVDDQAEVHYATIPARAVPTRNRDNRPATVVPATRELQSYDGTVWRLKLRKSATAQLGDSVTLYDYVAGFAPTQTHTISVEQYYLRRLTPGVEIVLVGDGAVLLADDNPTPRHGPALQGEPRVAERSMALAGNNHNYRWIVQSANYLLPVTDDVAKARAEEKRKNKRGSTGAPVALAPTAVSNDEKEHIKKEQSRMIATSRSKFISGAHGANAVAVSLLLSEYSETYLAYDKASAMWSCMEPPAQGTNTYAGDRMKFNCQTTFILRIDSNEGPAKRLVLEPCLAPEGYYPGELSESFDHGKILAELQRSPIGTANRPAPLKLFAVPWGASAKLASLETLRLLGVDIDAGAAWRSLEQEEVVQKSDAEIAQAGAEGTFGVQTIETIDYCRVGYNVVAMDPFNLQKNGLRAPRANPIFAEMRAGTTGSFYTENGYRLPLGVAMVRESGFATVEESKTFFSESEFLTKVSNDYSDVKNESTNWNVSAAVTVGTGGASPVTAQATVTAGGGGSSNYLYGAGSSYSSDVSRNASEEKTTIMRTKFDTDFWLVLNKRHLKLHSAFQSDVNNLLEPDEPGGKPRAVAFFEKYGTHYALASLFGARCTEFSAIENSKLTEAVSKNNGTFTKDGFIESSDSNANSSSNSSGLERSNKRTVGIGGSGTSFDAFVKGQVRDYVPIKAYFRPISELIQADLMTANPTHADVLKYLTLRLKVQNQLEEFLQSESQKIKEKVGEAGNARRPEKFAVEIKEHKPEAGLSADFKLTINAYLVQVPENEAIYVHPNDGVFPLGSNGYADPGYGDIVMKVELLSQDISRFPEQRKVSLGKPFYVFPDPSSLGSRRLCVEVIRTANGATPLFFASGNTVGPHPVGFQPGAVWAQNTNGWYDEILVEAELDAFGKMTRTRSTRTVQQFPDGKIRPTFRSDRLSAFVTGETADGTPANCGVEGIETFTATINDGAGGNKYNVTVTFRRVPLGVEESGSSGDGLPELSTLESK